MKSNTYPYEDKIREDFRATVHLIIKNYSHLEDIKMTSKEIENNVKIIINRLLSETTIVMENYTNAPELTSHILSNNIKYFTGMFYEGFLINKMIYEILESEKNQSNRIPISNQLKHEIWRRDKFTCQYCGKSINEVDLEVDHIMPVSKGGTNATSNLQTLCVNCNRKKSNK